MSTAPSPEDIYRRSLAEGERRLDMSPLNKVATGFIAGVTIVFGIVALGVVYALVERDLGPDVAEVAGALGFGIGLVFLVVGRSELFTENFFGPVAATMSDEQRDAWSLVRLWIVALVLNLLGGAVLTGILTIEGALPDGAPAALVTVAEEVASKSAVATLARAIAAGALLTLLSYMLHGCDSIRSRISVAYIVGFFVAIGPFDHVVVSALHLLFGMWLGGGINYGDIAANVGISTVGNLAGGLLLITLTHTAQVGGSEARGRD